MIKQRRFTVTLTTWHCSNGGLINAGSVGHRWGDAGDVSRCHQGCRLATYVADVLKGGDGGGNGQLTTARQAVVDEAGEADEPVVVVGSGRMVMWQQVDAEALDSGAG
ncbi:hypothetical protein ACLOJK_019281 [Asimina triloba]